MAINNDVKAYAESALAEAKKAAEEGRKPFYALVGLNELMFEQTKAMAEKTQAAIDSYRDQITDNVAKLRAELEKSYEDGRKKAAELQKNLSATTTHDVQASMQEYLNAVAKTYESLSDRGAALMSELSKSVSANPVVKRVADVSEKAADDAVALINRAQGAAQSAVSKSTPAANAPAAGASAASAPVKKAPAKKAPVKKAPAKSAPVKKAPVKKAPVKKAPVKKAPAKKAPAASTPAPADNTLFDKTTDQQD